jgi:glutaryl-CoA dehydrogenase
MAQSIQDTAPGPSRDGPAAFQWDDPFLLADQLTEEERLIQATARDFARERLLPRHR